MTFKYYKTTPLIISILILAALVDFAAGNWINPFLAQYLSAGSHFRIPTTVSILGIIFFSYNQYLWKLPVFNLLMNVPDMNGRYRGKINYRWNDVDKEKECFIEIVQTASKIKIQSYFSNGGNEKTSSKSLVEDIRQEEDGFFDVYLFYQNSGTKQNGGLDCHEGANKLRFIPRTNGKRSRLTGHYFTNRQIQTRGEIEATFLSKKIEGKF